jgi:hypothetical protein
VGSALRRAGGGGVAVFDAEGRVEDDGVETQLRLLGGEVARVAQRFAADLALHRMAECDEAAERVAAASA